MKKNLTEKLCKECVDAPESFQNEPCKTCLKSESGGYQNLPSWRPKAMEVNPNIIKLKSVLNKLSQEDVEILIDVINGIPDDDLYVALTEVSESKSKGSD